jgi:hypothetical protein
MSFAVKKLSSKRQLRTNGEHIAHPTPARGNAMVELPFSMEAFVRYMAWSRGYREAQRFKGRAKTCAAYLDTVVASGPRVRLGAHHGAVRRALCADRTRTRPWDAAPPRVDPERPGAGVLRPGPQACLRLQSRAAIRSFQRALELDSDLAMAHWGIALALGPNINQPMSRDAHQDGVHRGANGARAEFNASAAEHAYIDALAKRY